jgi:hypothetical protein
VSEYRKTAKVESEHILAQLVKAIFGDHPAAKTKLFQALQFRLVQRENTHTRFHGEIHPGADRFVEDRVDLAALHGADARRAIREARVVAHLAAPGDDVIEREACGRKDFFNDKVNRVIHLPPQRNAQWKPALADLAQGSQTGVFGDGKRKLVQRRDYSYRPKRNGIAKGPFAPNGESQRPGWIDHRHMDFAAGDLVDDGRTVAAKQADVPDLTALLSKIYPGLPVWPFVSANEFRCNF